MTRKKANEMSFFEHLGELRKRIIYSFAFVLVFFIASWRFVDKLYYWLSLPVLKFLPVLPTGEKKLAYTALAEPFMMYIKVAFIFSLFAASPFIFHQLWLFISPALFAKEKKWVFPFVYRHDFFLRPGRSFRLFRGLPPGLQVFPEYRQGFHGHHHHQRIFFAGLPGAVRHRDRSSNCRCWSSCWPSCASSAPVSCADISSTRWWPSSSWPPSSPRPRTWSPRPCSPCR